MSAIRRKLQGKYKGFGDAPPGWNDLGLVERDPEQIINGLDLSRFMGGGEDWLQDIYDVIRIAAKSEVLRGIFGEPQKYVSRNGISISVSSDLMDYSPAVAIRMIKSTLWAAEKTDRIALPTRLKVDALSNGLWIHWG
jgi:hypothetical protein